MPQAQVSGVQRARAKNLEDTARTILLAVEQAAPPSLPRKGGGNGDSRMFGETEGEL